MVQRQRQGPSAPPPPDKLAQANALFDAHPEIKYHLLNNSALKTLFDEARMGGQPQVIDWMLSRSDVAQQIERMAASAFEARAFIQQMKQEEVRPPARPRCSCRPPRSSSLSASARAAAARPEPVRIPESRRSAPRMMRIPEAGPSAPPVTWRPETGLSTSRTVRIPEQGRSAPRMMRIPEAGPSAPPVTWRPQAGPTAPRMARKPEPAPAAPRMERIPEQGPSVLSLRDKLQQVNALFHAHPELGYHLLNNTALKRLFDEARMGGHPQVIDWVLSRQDVEQQIERMAANASEASAFIRQMRQAASQKVPERA